MVAKAVAVLVVCPERLLGKTADTRGFYAKAATFLRVNPMGADPTIVEKVPPAYTLPRLSSRARASTEALALGFQEVGVPEVISAAAR